MRERQGVLKRGRKSRGGGVSEGGGVRERRKEGGGVRGGCKACMSTLFLFLSFIVAFLICMLGDLDAAL